MLTDEQLLDILKKAKFAIELGFEPDDCDVFGIHSNTVTDTLQEIDSMIECLDIGGVWF